MKVVLASSERSVIIEKGGGLFHRTSEGDDPLALIRTVQETIEVMRVKWGLIPVIGDQTFWGDGLPRLELAGNGFEIIRD